MQQIIKLPLEQVYKTHPHLFNTQGFMVEFISSKDFKLPGFSEQKSNSTNLLSVHHINPDVIVRSRNVRDPGSPAGNGNLDTSAEVENYNIITPPIIIWQGETGSLRKHPNRPLWMPYVLASTHRWSRVWWQGHWTSALVNLSQKTYPPGGNRNK